MNAWPGWVHDLDLEARSLRQRESGEKTKVQRKMILEEKIGIDKREWNP